MTSNKSLIRFRSETYWVQTTASSCCCCESWRCSCRPDQCHCLRASESCWWWRAAAPSSGLQLCSGRSRWTEGGWTRWVQAQGRSPPSCRWSCSPAAWCRLHALELHRNTETVMNLLYWAHKWIKGMEKDLWLTAVDCAELGLRPFDLNADHFTIKGVY